jgi:hypothetical protein
VDSGEDVSGGFVVAGGDSTILLEPADEILNEMTCLVHLFIEFARSRVQCRGCSSTILILGTGNEAGSMSWGPDFGVIDYDIRLT